MPLPVSSSSSLPSFRLCREGPSLSKHVVTIILHSISIHGENNIIRRNVLMLNGSSEMREYYCLSPEHIYKWMQYSCMVFVPPCRSKNYHTPPNTASTVQSHRWHNQKYNHLFQLRQYQNPELSTFLNGAHRHHLCFFRIQLIVEVFFALNIMEWI